MAHSQAAHVSPPVQERETEHPRGTWFAPETRNLVPHGEVLGSVAGQAALFLGETHDRPEIHRWQLHVIAGLDAMEIPIAVGFEMFPRAVQAVLDRWVDGELTVEDFLDRVEWRRHWGFDPELYLPIFNFCRQMGVPMVALNCDRALVSRVRREGWEAIPVADRDGLTPSAAATPAYRQYLLDILNGFREDAPARVMDARFDGFVAAQQVWDRAFAVNVVAARERYPDRTIVGIVGRGHLEFGHGTPHQLRDLGVDNSKVFLTREAMSPRDARAANDLAPGICDAVFCLDAVEAPRPGPPRTGIVVEEGDWGVVVSSVDDDSPAAAAGVRRGDLVRRLCRQVVETRHDALGLLRRLPHGVSVPFEVEREGARVSLVLCLPPPGARRSGPA